MRVGKQRYKLWVMQNSGKIIVSMTSYPGRIKNVGMSIFLLLSKQTIKPDEIHLWLAESQFPLKENSLPADLQQLVKLPQVNLHWLCCNTYVHKRHEIFKIVEPDDCVFLIDDDVMYRPSLIESVMRLHRACPNSIVCYNNYHVHKYSGRHIKYEMSTLGVGPFVNKVRWCGQSMIPAGLYPQEILDAEHQAIRNKTSPISDECWFQPWVVFHDIPIMYAHYDWGVDIDPNNGKDKGLVSWSHKKCANGYEHRDNWLYAVLCAYPQLLNKYKKEFGYERSVK